MFISFFLEIEKYIGTLDSLTLSFCLFFLPLFFDPLQHYIYLFLYHFLSLSFFYVQILFYCFQQKLSLFLRKVQGVYFWALEFIKIALFGKLFMEFQVHDYGADDQLQGSVRRLRLNDCD